MSWPYSHTTRTSQPNHSQNQAESGAGELLGVHEGPRSRALESDALPPVQSLQRQPGDGLREDSVIPYSKGAAFFAMLEALWDQQLPGSFQVSSAPDPACRRIVCLLFSVVYMHRAPDGLAVLLCSGLCGISGFLVQCKCRIATCFRHRSETLSSFAGPDQLLISGRPDVLAGTVPKSACSCQESLRCLQELQCCSTICMTEEHPVNQGETLSPTPLSSGWARPVLPARPHRLLVAGGAAERAGHPRLQGCQPGRCTARPGPPPVHSCQHDRAPRG